MNLPNIDEITKLKFLASINLLATVWFAATAIVESDAGTPPEPLFIITAVINSMAFGHTVSSIRALIYLKQLRQLLESDDDK